MRRTLILLAALGILAAGCGGGSSGGYGSGGGSGSATTATTAATGSQGGGYGDYGSEQDTGGGGGAAAGTAVAIDGFQFSPATLKVKRGRQVTWTNKQSVAHTVTADDGAFDRSMPAGATFSLAFPKAGSFAYHCSIHPTMHGTIVVS
ncbi:MAG TPA: cupredoxin family copper-binding protein [Actinomycetes bacterium]|nr:cupredoxin family copper-binding protein [Actinomycetes bacterium]